MSSNGYIKLHRKIVDAWQWETAEWGHAWVTMMLMAEYEDQDALGLKRGQFFSSISDLSRKAKIPETSLRRFLKRCLDEKDLVWEKAPGGRKSGGVTGGVTGGVLSRFTIVKFDYYNGLCGGDSGGVSGSSSNRKKKKEKEHDSDESLSTNSNPKQKPTRKREQLKSMLESVDRHKVQKEFPNVDAQSVWIEFVDVVLNGSASDNRPNPYKYTNFQKAFRNWVKGRKPNYRRPMEDNSNNPAYKPFPKLNKEKPPQIKSERLSGDGDE